MAQGLPDEGVIDRFLLHRSCQGSRQAFQPWGYQDGGRLPSSPELLQAASQLLRHEGNVVEAIEYESRNNDHIARLADQASGFFRKKMKVVYTQRNRSFQRPSTASVQPLAFISLFSTVCIHLSFIRPLSRALFYLIKFLKAFCSRNVVFFRAAARMNWGKGVEAATSKLTHNVLGLRCRYTKV